MRKHRPEPRRTADRPDPERRRTLRLLGAAAAGAAAQGVFGVACGGPETVAATEVPLAQLPIGERVRVLHGETPIELIRTEDGIEARSLWCTHYGCEVAWREDQGRYLCPCHEGVFDGRGRVMSGPPPRPLQRVEARVDGDVVVLDPGAV